MQRLTILGDLGSATFLPWVTKHCNRLGLTCRPLCMDATRAVFDVEGQPELIDALEVGCLLGPIDVWVDAIERGPSDFDD